MKQRTNASPIWRRLSRAGLIAAVCVAGSAEVGFGNDSMGPALSDQGRSLQSERPQRTARAFTREVVLEALLAGPQFEFNTLRTALPDSNSPAYADIIVDPQDNFLPCEGGPFALCYYSGPDGPLPCDTRRHDPLSECTCIEIAYGPYYVDINAILDVDTYLQTIGYCGQSGEKCTTKNSAPVCTIINANSLFPGADLISVFSFACAEEQNIGQTSCAPAVYAGCMTAPCYRRDGDDSGTVDCLCPNFDGPYQIGQTLADPQQCFLGDRNVWSASYNINASDAGGSGGGDLELAATVPTPDGCIPDDPNPDVGCPLLPADWTSPIAPDSELCQQACQEYSQCTRNDIEIGFTCDATLCTAGCNDLGLVGEACAGLKPPQCQTTAIIQVETLAECSCCASQICGCEASAATNAEIAVLNDLQRQVGVTPQCDLNGTLCGELP